MNKITAKDVLSVINEADNLEIEINQLDDYLQDLGMDSITFIQIIVRLEEAFECEIPDSKLLMTEMDTVQKIIDVLQELNDQKNTPLCSWEG